MKREDRQKLLDTLIDTMVDAMPPDDLRQTLRALPEVIAIARSEAYQDGIDSALALARDVLTKSKDIDGQEMYNAMRGAVLRARVDAMSSAN